MADASSIGVVAALLAGGISFVSPCVLPLVPGYVSYIAGQTELNADTKVRRTIVLGLSLCFVLGFSTIFIILGAGATVLGQALLRWRYELNLVGGGVVILFGLFMIGVARIAPMQRDLRIHLNLPVGRAGSAYILGLAFGFGWTPCIGPILGAILTASATSATLDQGVGLLAVYSAGLGVPFLIVAAFTNRLSRRLRAIRRFGRGLHQAAGVIMVIVGVAMMAGELSALSYWLLGAFPALGRIG